MRHNLWTRTIWHRDDPVAFPPVLVLVFSGTINSPTKDRPMAPQATAPETTMHDHEMAPEAPLLPLVERLARATVDERAGVLLAAIASGQPLDLAGADLRGIDLRPGRPARGTAGDGPAVVPTTVVLDGADLTGAILSRAYLSRVSLRGACLGGALLVEADLHGADLSGAMLRGANLTGANLSRADLSFANLQGASLLTANLSEATATGADLRESVLHAAVLPRAILRAADLRWSGMDGANVAGAVLDGARLEGASLNLANLAGARLSPTTDFSYAFLHHARLERTGISRANLRGGVGESATDDLELIRGTYRTLQRVFEADGRTADARWAHRRAMRACTASHRPDRARRYHAPMASRAAKARSAEESPPPAGQRLLFAARHASHWLLGLVADHTTGYGTSIRRVVATIAITWLVFALIFATVGGVIDLTGSAPDGPGLALFSAAALTPIDPYPLAAVSSVARTLALLEGVLGMVLVGALGYVSLARLRS